MNDEMNAAPDDDEIRAYVARHFWPIGDLALASGVSEQEAEAMIAGACAPGVIYAFDGEGWWSALGGYRSGAAGRPSDDAERWYSPAAAWGLRRARLAVRDGASIADAAARNRAQFQADFTAALHTVPEAANAFPSCFGADGGLDHAAAGAQAAAEWSSWLAGGYAVCLRIFNAGTCVAKEALAATLKRHIADPASYPMGAGEILALCERLTQLMLPFSPWERSGCTPGVTIDRLLRDLSLGCELPYAMLSQKKA
ncbi:MAG: hypothetical protein JWR80_6503 [Bradyrhizobium sp.]|nr:hypothetical protein [Bradyrhizobium sp.]